MMNIDRRVFATLLMSSLAGYSSADDGIYPSKAIKIVVPVAPGGITDILARLVGQKLQERTGQQVVVENRTGAGGQIGNDFVARAPADGYTLLMSSQSLASEPFTSKTSKLDPMRDFLHVGEVARAPFLMFVSANVPAKNITELVAHAKANPGKLNWATLAFGQDLDLRMFEQRTGTQFTAVRYRGTAPVMTAMLADEVQGHMGSYRGAKEFIETGKVRAIGFVSHKGLRVAPNIPTLSASGLPGYTIPDSWIGVSAPAGVPAAVVATLNAHINAIVALPDVQERLAAMGNEGTGGTSAQFTQTVKDTMDYFSNAQRVTGLQPE